MPITINGDTGVTYPVTAGGTSAVQASSSKILQVVNVSTTTRQSFVIASAGTYSDTGLTASITPSSSTSKVLVLVTATHQSQFNGATNCGSALGLKRGSTNIAGFVGNHTATISNAETLSPTGNIIMLDSPATTSSTTYTVQITSVGNNTTVWFNGTYSNTGFTAFITLMEIAA